MKSLQNKIHTSIHNGRFRVHFSWLLAIALLSQSLAPLLAQDPGYLPPADPTDAIVESWQPTPGVEPDFMVGEPPLPYWEPVLEASSLAELAPAHFSSSSAVLNGMVETTTLSPGGHQTTFDNGTVMLLAETSAASTPIAVAVSPLQSLADEPPFPDGSKFQLTLALTDTQTGEMVADIERPFYLAFDLRTLVPSPDAGAAWFIALRLPDDSGWQYPEITVHDPAGLLSIPLDRGDYKQVVVGIQAAASDDTPKPWRYQWQVPAVSTFSGAATYQYPVEVPPGRAGLTPNIDISYSSGGLNGLSYTTGVDQGLLGLGWQINQIQITRRTVGLGGTDHADQRVYPKHGNHFDLVINGASHHLVYYRQEGNVYFFYAENAPGLRVRQIYAPDAVGINRDAVYWTVQTPDGTTYRLGYDESSETGQKSWPLAVYMSSDQAAGKLGEYSGLRWMVDTITDIHGNQIQYDYEERWLDPEGYGSGDYGSNITTSRTRPVQIRYNFQAPALDANTRVSGSYASKIEFADNHRIREIRLYHLNMAAPYRTVDIALVFPNWITK